MAQWTLHGFGTQHSRPGNRVRVVTVSAPEIDTPTVWTVDLAFNGTYAETRILPDPQTGR